MTDDPFWPPEPGPLDQVTLGELPFVLVRVHGGYQYPPPPGQTVTLEVWYGGGLNGPGASAVLHAAGECREVTDLGITWSGTLVQKLSDALEATDGVEDQ